MRHSDIFAFGKSDIIFATKTREANITEKTLVQKEQEFFLELLARFELATSSLPTILEPFLTCVSYRKLLDKTFVYQRLFEFAYRCLL